MDILVLNNDLMERSVIQQVLEHNNHRVTFTNSIEEAWKMITGNRFRFVIADATMQAQHVHQLIQQVRSLPDVAAQIYFLLITNKGQNGNLIASLGVGADDYLNTPINPQDLKARVSVGVRFLQMGDTLAQAHNQLEHLALYDDLTGLMNRQAFYKVAQGELERARRASTGVSIIAMDVNNLRSINETHGHEIGDEVLQIVAQVIREKSRPYDCIGHWEGDQFTIALPDVLSTDAEKIARRILAGIKSSGIMLTDGTELKVELSIGVAAALKINAYAEIDTFIQSAMQAMHNSKISKENEISVNLI